MSRTKIALYCLVGVAILAALIAALPTRQLAVDIVGQIRDFGAHGPLVFFIVFLLAALLGFSRSVLAIAAGVLFDPAVAVSVVIAASMAAYMGTFTLARYFIADWVAVRLQRYPVAKNLMTAVDEHGFRLLVLMRMNPFVPGFVNGYGFGLTSIKPLHYLGASVVGNLPLTLIYVYLGWAGGVSLLTSGEQPDSLRSGGLAIGVFVSIVALVFIGWHGRRVLRAASANPSNPGQQQ